MANALKPASCCGWYAKDVRFIGMKEMFFVEVVHGPVRPSESLFLALMDRVRPDAIPAFYGHGGVSGSRGRGR